MEDFFHEIHKICSSFFTFNLLYKEISLNQPPIHLYTCAKIGLLRESSNGGWNVQVKFTKKYINLLWTKIMASKVSLFYEDTGLEKFHCIVKTALLRHLYITNHCL